VSNFCITYHLDKENRIVYLSDEWQLFADENKASHLTAETVLNKSLYDFVTDRKSKHIYKMLVDRSTKSKKILQFSFRCDAPDRRRFMSMKIIPLEGGLVGFKSCIEREEHREPVLILDFDADRSDEVLVICGWCKKIKIDENNWVEVEAAIDTLELFENKSLPELSHGMCESCYENALKGT